MQARMLIFGMQVDNDLLYRGIKNQPSPAYSSLYLSNFLSFHTLMKCFVKDFSSTMQGRMLIFGMQLDDDLLYRGIENQSSPAYSSLYLSNFLSFHTLKSDIFVKDFSRTMQPRMLIFGMHVDDDLLYWDWEQAFSCLFFPIFVQFISVHTFKNAIFRKIFLKNHSS